MDFKEKNSKQESKNKKEIKILDESKEIDLTIKTPKKQKIVKDIIDDSKFLEILRIRDLQDFSPSLDQVEIAASAAGATDLEQQVGFNSTQTQDKEDDKDDLFKYNAGSDSAEGPKYTSLREEGAKMFQAQRTSPLDFRREKPFETNVQEVGRSGFFEQKTSSKNIETYVPAKSADPLRASKEDVFEKQDIKYSPSGD